MRRELDSRINERGERLTLVHYPDSGVLELELVDARGVVRTVPVAELAAQDAFQRPHAYLSAAYGDER